VDQLTLYFDRNIGRAVPEALKTLRLTVEHHGDHFSHAERDDIWLRVVGQRGWVVFTHDRRLHTRDVELAAIMQWNVACFYLWGAESSRWEKMRCFARAYDSVIAVCKSSTRPFVYRIDGNGTLRQITLPTVAQRKSARLR
jgi:hypothetical protein